MTWLEFPFTGGAHEDIEARLMPNGMLSSVKNLRHDKEGRWSKRPRYSAVTLTSQHTGSGASIPDNELLSLSSLGPDRLVLGGNPSRLYNFAESRTRVTPFSPDESGEYWNPSQYTAARQTIVQTMHESYDTLTDDNDSATNNGYTVVACLDVDGNLVAHVYSEDDGGTFLFSQELDDASNDPKYVQAVACGVYIVVAWTQDGTNSLLFKRLDCTDVTGIASFDAAATSVGNTEDLGGPASMQVGIGANPRLLFAWQSGDDDLSFAIWNPVTPAVVNAGSFDAGVVGTLSANIYGHQTDDLVCLAWTNNLSAEVYTRFYNYGMSSSTVIFTTETGGNLPLFAPVMARRTATTLWIAWDERNVDLVRGIRHGVVTSTTGVLSGAGHAWSWRLASTMILSPDETYPLALATPDLPTELDIRTAYHLIRLELGMRVQEPLSQLRFAEGLVRKTTPAPRPHISFTDGEDYLFAGPTYPQQLGRTTMAWRWRDDGYERGQPVKFGSALYFTGGAPWRWDGVEPRLAGFSDAPIVVELTASTLGSLTQDSTYGYLCVSEREEHDGSVTLSAPGEAKTIALSAGQDDVEVTVRALRMTIAPSKLRIYRTIGNGAVYYLLRTVNALGYTSDQDITFTDTMSDADLENQPLLYAQNENGVLGNDPMPPCRFAFRAGQRLWVGGGDEGTRWRCSKTLFVGESAAFPAAEEFSVSTSEPGLGGGSLDGVPVLFTENTINVVQGPGPDDTGVGLFETRELPANSGLHEGGHRSIVECAHGLLYWGRDGIYLIPRGFGAPEHVGAAIRDTLDGMYITSAVLCAEANEVRFTLSDGPDNEASRGFLAIWDLESKVWILKDLDSAPVGAADWGGTHVIGFPGSSNEISVMRETAGYSTTHQDSQITTGDVRPGAVSRYGRCREVQLLLEYREPCTITAELSLDGGFSYPYEKEWILAGPVDEGDPNGLTIGQTVALKWHLPQQKANRFRLRFTDSAEPANGTEGVVYLGMAFDLRNKEGGYRLPAARR